MLIVGAVITVALTIFGATFGLWFWWLPSARILVQTAERCGKKMVPEFMPARDTEEFLVLHVGFRSRITLIDRVELAQDQVSEISRHFVFFIAFVLFIALIVIVRGTEANLPRGSDSPAASARISMVGQDRMHLQPITFEAAPSTAPEAGPLPTPAGLGSGTMKEEILSRLKELWMAPVLELGLLFAGLYAISLLLRDVRKLRKADQ